MIVFWFWFTSLRHYFFFSPRGHVLSLFMFLFSQSFLPVQWTALHLACSCQDVLIPLHRLHQSWTLPGCKPGILFFLWVGYLRYLLRLWEETNINIVYTFSESLPIIPGSKCSPKETSLSHSLTPPPSPSLLFPLLLADAELVAINVAHTALGITSLEWTKRRRKQSWDDTSQSPWLNRNALILGMYTFHSPENSSFSVTVIRT